MVSDSKFDFQRTAGRWHPLLWSSCIFQTRGNRTRDLLHTRLVWHQSMGWAGGDESFSWAAPQGSNLLGFQSFLCHGWQPSPLLDQQDPLSIWIQTLLCWMCRVCDIAIHVGEETPGRERLLNVFQTQNIKALKRQAGCSSHSQILDQGCCWWST